ncbi:hypothetical protein VTJ49DRAFT_5811 [Mycothermus thermophilus]|uniref:Uncharacterized protein n=1 Tax=Humicola insolens TaxID=85995 RepID=A0ABR3VR85_HUMIN
MLEVIYVTRHGFRSNWLVDPSNGSYTPYIRSPTGVGADPALTAHGVDQANELAVRLLELDPPVERVYSSLYYRCLQTVEPFVRKTQEVAQTFISSSDSSSSSTGPATGTGAGAGTTGAAARLPLRIRGETGLGEWYGSADFDHPVPAPLEKLDELFPGLLKLDYRPAVTPNRKGESIDELHERVAAALEALIAECDRDGVRAVLLCSHAAVIIALGRVLTGQMPDSHDVEDFKCFTCGLSAYRRRRWLSGSGPAADGASVDQRRRDGPAGDWRGGRGVSGGWDCELNSDCRHLSQGEERGWYGSHIFVFLGSKVSLLLKTQANARRRRFSGDESFKHVPTGPSLLDAGTRLGEDAGNSVSGTEGSGELGEGVRGKL